MSSGSWAPKNTRSAEWTYCCPTAVLGRSCCGWNWTWGLDMPQWPLSHILGAVSSCAFRRYAWNFIPLFSLPISLFTSGLHCRPNIETGRLSVKAFISRRLNGIQITHTLPDDTKLSLLQALPSFLPWQGQAVSLDESPFSFPFNCRRIIGVKSPSLPFPPLHSLGGLKELMPCYDHLHIFLSFFAREGEVFGYIQ